MMKLTESGDTELWVVHGEGWSLPVYVHPYSGEGREYFQVTVAIPANNAQFAAIDNILAPISSAPYDQFWLIEASDLKKVSEKAQGITPARYVKWATSGEVKPKHVVLRRSEAAVAGLNAAFLKFVNSKHSLTDTQPQLRYIWFVLCTEMAQWLHHGQKSIDLGFATLDAVPYRANWKQVLLSKFPWFMGLVRKFKKQPAFLANLALTEFPSELRRTDLAAINKEAVPFIGWSLEVTPTNTWHEFVKESEQRLIIENGAESYVAYWKSRVDKSEKRAVEIFKAFVEETAKPCATIRESDHGSNRRLVPLIPSGRVNPVSPDRGADVVVTKNPDDTGRPSNAPPALVHENAKLHEVSIVRFEPSELRNGGNGDRN